MTFDEAAVTIAVLCGLACLYSVYRRVTKP